MRCCHGHGVRSAPLVARRNGCRTAPVTEPVASPTKKKGDYDRAIKDFDGAIKLDPKYANAFANRAQAYLNKGDYERAALDYDEAIRLKPTLEALRSGRCWAGAIIGDLQAALADCNEALRLAPNVLPHSTRAG